MGCVSVARRRCLLAGSRLFESKTLRARDAGAVTRARAADSRHDPGRGPSHARGPRSRDRGHAGSRRRDPGDDGGGSSNDHDAPAVTRSKEDKMDSKDKKRGTGGEFLSDVKELRRRARQHIEDGAVTQGYGADPEKVVAVLNEALATEIVCVLRYKRHYFMAQGIHAQAVAAEFLQHANEEQGHADQISARLVQLGGAPNLNPNGLLSRSHSEYVEAGSLVDMLKENLVAERIAIDSYGEMVRYIGNDDPTTR